MRATGGRRTPSRFAVSNRGLLLPTTRRRTPGTSAIARRSRPLEVNSGFTHAASADPAASPARLFKALSARPPLRASCRTPSRAWQHRRKPERDRSRASGADDPRQQPDADGRAGWARWRCRDAAISHDMIALLTRRDRATAAYNDPDGEFVHGSRTRPAVSARPAPFSCAAARLETISRDQSAVDPCARHSLAPPEPAGTLLAWSPPARTPCSSRRDQCRRPRVRRARLRIRRAAVAL